MALHWMSGEYFSKLLQKDKRSHAALELLVDDIHSNKEKTINTFLCHSGSEDFLWSLVRLLGNENTRVAGNSAYIIGTLAESELGSIRVLSLTSSPAPEAARILADLTSMLVSDDTESVMNAAGTMGTLAESHEGRSWILKEACLDVTIENVTSLLTNENVWSASNAALVLARMTIAEQGCERLLQHDKSSYILSSLITSLGVDEAGRGMNAAFAIGRLCDIESGRARLLSLPESERMISLLAKMLCCSDPGASKNACFALSCLATNLEGHKRLLQNAHSDVVLQTLSELLSAEDNETGWFAAMTLRTLAGQPMGCLRLRGHPSISPALKAAENKSDVNADLKSEVTQTLEILKRLEKPIPPEVKVLGATEVHVSWAAVTSKSGFPVSFQVFEGGRPVWSGGDLSCHVTDLEPHTQYSFRLRAVSEGDDSPLSDPATICTDEALPGLPCGLRLLGCTPTQLKVGWDPPTKVNGISKGYYIHNGKMLVEHTSEQTCIISGLTPNTSYVINVCASTSKGRGPQESLSCSTSESGAHAPSKPEVTVMGRSELHVSWRPPDVVLGRIFRYELVMNGEVVYSGTEMHFVARRLKPDTEYSNTVIAVTSEGKWESKTAKKRTSKDEFEPERAPLYPCPKKDNESEKKEDPPKVSPKRRKSLSQEVPFGRKQTHRGGSASIKKKISIAMKSPEHADKAKPDKDPEHVQTSEWDQNSKANKSNPVVKLAYTHTEKPRDQSTDHVKKGPTEHQEVKKSEVTERQISHMAQCESWDYSVDACPKEEQRNATLTQKNKKFHNNKKYRDAENTETSRVPLDTTSRSHELQKPDKSRVLVHLKTSVTHSVPVRLSAPPSHPATADHYVSPSPPRQPGGGGVHAPRATPSTGGKLSRHRHEEQTRSSSRRSSAKSTASTLSVSMEDGIHQLAAGDRHNRTRVGSHDSGLAWLAARRTEMPSAEHSVTKMMSGNIPASLIAAVPTTRTGFIELESPTAIKSNPFANNIGFHRASTFVSSHRPAAKKNLEKITVGNPALMNAVPQFTWQPDLPSTRQERSHNKFVPMQFRTQPANLPGHMTRQNTNSFEKSFSPMEVLGRSRTEIRPGMLSGSLSKDVSPGPWTGGFTSHKDQSTIRDAERLRRSHAFGEDAIPNRKSHTTGQSQPGVSPRHLVGLSLPKTQIRTESVKLQGAM